MKTTSVNNGYNGDVIVIGGGIGGLALALFLKKAGVRSTVYEAYEYKAGIGGGLGLAPNGVNVLAALGLAEKLKARGTVALENIFYNEKGRQLARYKNGTVAQYGQPAVCLTRAALHDLLMTEAQQQGIQVEFCKRLTDIRHSGDEVVAYFEDGSSASADLLIGSDGIHSRTRQIILPDGPKPSYVGIIGVGGIVPASVVRSIPTRIKQSFTFTFGSKGFFGTCGADNGDMMWWSNLPSKHEMSREELADLSLDTIKKDMLEIYGGYHEPIELLIRNTTAPSKVNVSDIQSLPTWHKGRVLLIGDAAHAVSPNAGQGASMALEDAMYLGKLFRDEADYETIFAQFEAGRKPRVERIVAEGRRRGGDKEIVTPLQETIREVMMAIFMNLFGEKGQDWLYSYKIEWA